VPLDAQALLAAELPERHHSWTADDVILYGLGLGAGVPATSPAELAYVYERGLTVLPTFGVLAASQSLLDLFALDAFDVELAQILHGEQALAVHAPLPTQAEVTVRPRVSDVYDTGRHAITVLETTTTVVGEPGPLCTNRFSLFIRGGGGFGGARGPAADDGAPERDADHVVECPILEQQALIYRLSGDKNPLHADPKFAKGAGFNRPILHGLCTYGMVARAAVEASLGGDVSRLSAFQARFAGVVYPGETLRISVWEEAERLVLAVDVPSRDGATVLTGALMPVKVASPTGR
jgi:acyl dehydratase